MQRAGRVSAGFGWCFPARDVTGKVLAIVWPISAFVALGFEHSVANMYLIPVGMLAGAGFDIGGFAQNLFWVTLGNIVGGAGGVALVYWTIYLRPGAHGCRHPLSHRATIGSAYCCRR